MCFPAQELEGSGPGFNRVMSERSTHLLPTARASLPGRSLRTSAEHATMPMGGQDCPIGKKGKTSPARPRGHRSPGPGVSRQEGSRVVGREVHSNVPTWAGVLTGRGIENTVTSAHGG